MLLSKTDGSEEIGSIPLGYRMHVETTGTFPPKARRNNSTKRRLELEEEQSSSFVRTIHSGCVPTNWGRTRTLGVRPR